MGWLGWDLKDTSTGVCVPLQLLCQCHFLTHDPLNNHSNDQFITSLFLNSEFFNLFFPMLAEVAFFKSSLV